MIQALFHTTGSAPGKGFSQSKAGMEAKKRGVLDVPEQLLWVLGAP